MINREVRSAESVSEAVVHAVSTLEDCHPRALPSLYGVVNPEALNDLFRRDTEHEARRSDLVSFRFSESLVTVGADERIRVERSQTPVDTD
ncbi:HalOD1 output domain-containing protein [Haloarcula amylolytica]|uniref:HalOD1 output domain-containing protein n=1 Tax=Haloarcula amylolytica TaxID=396317 RepID=UPI003C74528E